MKFLKTYQNGVCLQVHAQPNASCTDFRGVHGDALKIAVRSPPVDGAANEEIQRFLAEFFSRSARDVEILRGETSRKKSVYISGVSMEAASALLEKVLSS